MLKKLQAMLMDICIVIVLLAFYIVVDAVYPYLMFNMGLQLSDWWLAANVVIPIIELICCMIIEISAKNEDGKINDNSIEIIRLLATIAAGITGQQLPEFTSGEKANEDECYDDSM